MTTPHNQPTERTHQPLPVTACLWRIAVSLLIVALLVGAGLSFFP